MSVHAHDQSPSGFTASTGVLNRLKRGLARFHQDVSGSLTMVSTLMLVTAVGITAVSIDGGNYFFQRRKQQTAADIASLAAASNLAQSQNLALQSTGLNGYAASALSNVEVGTYQQNPSIPASQRFVVGGASPNAVRVTLVTTPPFIFGGPLELLTSSQANQNAASPTGFSVRTRAIAMNQDAASFALGTGLAQLNGGIENAILGALLGSQLSLSLADWQSLASANIDMFSFAQALNTRANLQAATFSTVAAATVTEPQALLALSDALSASGASANAAAALSKILFAATAGGGNVAVSKLVSFGQFGVLNVASASPVTAKVSALDLLNSVLQISNGQSEVQGTLGASIPGLGTVNFSIVFGQSPVSSGLITIGATGTTLRSSQVRLVLKVSLVGAAQVGLINLPIYLNVANGTARLASVQCSVPSSEVTLGVTPGLVDAYIGSVSDSDLTSSANPSVGNATLINLLGLVQVTGQAHATIANTSETLVPYSQADIAAQTQKVTSTTDFAGSLVSSLLGNLSLNVSVLGGTLFLPFDYGQSIKQTLAAAASPLDLLLNSTFSALGLRLGNATTWVSGVSCGRSSLVN